MKKFKMRIYHTKESNKGNLKKELYFDTLEEMKTEYNKLFQYSLFGLNPTLWIYNNEIKDYTRMAGY